MEDEDSHFFEPSSNQPNIWIQSTGKLNFRFSLFILKILIILNFRTNKSNIMQ